jgi:hypothetical protein
MVPSPQIDRQLEHRRLFDRKVGRVGTLHDFVDKLCATPPKITEIGAVRHQSVEEWLGTCSYEYAQAEHRRQFGPETRDDDLPPSGARQWIFNSNQTVHTGCDALHGPRDVADIANRHRHNPQA